MTWANRATIGRAMMQKRQDTIARSGLLILMNDNRTRSLSTLRLGRHGGPPRTYATWQAMDRAEMRRSMRLLRYRTAKMGRGMERSGKTIIRLAGAIAFAFDPAFTGKDAPIVIPKRQNMEVSGTFSRITHALYETLDGSRQEWFPIRSDMDGRPIFQHFDFWQLVSPLQTRSVAP